MRQKRKLKERQNEVERKKRQVDCEDRETDQLRIHLQKRKDQVSKKEIIILEWSKKNNQDKVKNEAEYKETELHSEYLIREELKIHDFIKMIKRKEEDEIPQRIRLVKAKQGIMDKL